MLEKGKRVIESHGLYYFIDEKGHKVKFKPWLGDSVGFLYDIVMEKNIFPRKFGASIEKHYQILREMMSDVHGMEVLELAAGSGSAVHFLANDNHYTGSDISVSLLLQAKKKLAKAGFEDSEFYVTCAEESVFAPDSFSICLCILSIIFFSDLKQFVKELRQILQPDGLFFCCVPVPERNIDGSKIRGKLYSAVELQEIFTEHNFNLIVNTAENGTLLYFKAVNQNN